MQYQTGVGGILEYYPREGRPSEAFVTCYASGNSLLFAREAIVLDSASESISAVDAADDELAVSDASAFVVGRRYWVASSGGWGRDVTVLDKDDALVILDAPVGRRVPTGTISGHGLRRMLSPAEAGTSRRRCRVVWEYTVGGVVYRDERLIDIVPDPFRLNITEADIEEAYPQFGEHVGSTRGWAKVARRAEAEVFNHLVGLQVEPDTCPERDMLRDAAVYRTLQLLAVGEESETGTDESPFVRWGKLYEQTLQRYVAGRPWVDRNADQVADESGEFGAGDERGLRAPMLGIG